MLTTRLAQTTKTRRFFAALNYIWNRPDNARILKLGPDRACAEWLMKNGATVRWVGTEQFVQHFDHLPLDPKTTGENYKIEEVMANDASITHHGFSHFNCCEYITKITFANCKYIDDTCLERLELLSNSLTDLTICGCPNVNCGLHHLTKLQNLKHLRLGDLRFHEDIDETVTALRGLMPNCTVEIVCCKETT